MTPSRPAAAALLLVLLLAGCAAPTTEVEPARGAQPPARAALETLPTFASPLLLAGPGLNGVGGEPSVAAAPDGTLYVSAPLIPGECRSPASLVTGKGCGQGRVWRSDDGGATFKLLNDADGRLTPEGRGNGDTDVAVGPDGRVHFVDLGGGVPYLVSDDRGETWTNRGILNPEDTVTDRQWIDAEGDFVAVIWAHQGEDPRGIDFTASYDAGATWTSVVSLTRNMIQLGPVEIAPNGIDVYVPYVHAQTRDLRVLVSHDQGTSWQDVATGHVLPVPGALASPAGVRVGGHWSPTVIFPVAAADRAGNVYVAFSEYAEGREGTSLMLTASLDAGATWSPPRPVVDRANAVFPWLVAGEAGRVALAYLASDVAMDPNVGPHEWRLELAASFEADAAEPPWAVGPLSPGVVHTGALCPDGGGCTRAPYVYGDRTMLDFFEIALAPGGRLVAVWTQTTSTTREPMVMFAAQTGGDRLLPAAP